MKKLFVFILVGLFLFPILIIGESEKKAEHWQGTLSVSSIELHIVFNIEKSKDNKYTGTLDSPDQGAYGIPITDITIINDTWTIKIAAVAGGFKGIKKGESIEGTWSQGGQTFPLNLKQVKKIERPKRPQNPKKPYPYIEKEVSYKNEKENFNFGGTLTIPNGKGPFPAVILITGSGSQDRDETVMNHKPFLIIADYLTRRGIAVLRVDDRGVGKTGGSPAKSTTMNFVDDVLYGIKFLKTQKEINKDKIGLVGHSEGGIIAPLVAVRSKDVKFIVLLAGTGVNGEKILLAQSKLIAEAEGIDKKTIKNNYKQQKQIYKMLRSIKDEKQLNESLNKLLHRFYNKLPKTDREKLGDPEKKIEMQVKQISSPWFRFFLTYDPAKTLRNVKCPVLAMGGSLDLQVPAKENLKAIKKALKKANNKNVKIVEIEGLNHLFQPAKTGAISEYRKIETTFSPKALKIMGDWIKERVK